MMSSFFPGQSESAFRDSDENSCIDCHQRLDDARLANPVKLWQTSVHAAVGNTCDGCHGGNPKDPSEASMSPENKFFTAPEEDEITTFCGKCHQELARNFKTSAHWETGAQNCIGCHGVHDIHTISPDIISEEKCGECHEYGSSDKLKTILVQLHGNFQNAQKKLNMVTGLPIQPVLDDLDKIWKQLRRVRMISHTFDMDQVEKEAGRVQNMIGEETAEIDILISKVRERETWGYAAVIVFFLLSVVTYFLNRSEGPSGDQV